MLTYQILKSKLLDKLMYRNNILVTFSDYNNKNEIGIYKNKRSRELIKIEDVDIINPISRNLGRDILNYLSNFKIYNYDTNSGLLNHLTIRNNDKNEFMLEFYIHEYNENLLNKIKTYTNENVDIKSIYYQIVKNKNDFRNEYILLHGDKYLNYNVLDKTICIQAGSFFQTNNIILQDMYSDIFNYLDKGKLFIDLYCGVGIMSILVSEKYDKCIGIEINKNAIEVASYNMNINNCKNCNFICSSVENVINNIDMNNAVIFINPPRRGLYSNVINKINSLKSNIKQILYLSCNKNSLERDLKLFNFKYEYIKQYNMFPKTIHNEYLVNLFL